jgi:hypothetical protein
MKKMAEDNVSLLGEEERQKLSRLELENTSLLE